MSWNIEAGAEITHITWVVADYTQIGLNLRRAMRGSSSDGVGCISMNDAECEQPYCFEEQIIENMAMINFRSGNDAFDKKSGARNAFAEVRG